MSRIRFRDPVILTYLLPTTTPQLTPTSMTAWGLTANHHGRDLRHRGANPGFPRQDSDPLLLRLGATVDSWAIKRDAVLTSTTKKTVSKHSVPTK